MDNGQQQLVTIMKQFPDHLLRLAVRPTRVRWEGTGVRGGRRLRWGKCGLGNREAFPSGAPVASQATAPALVLRPLLHRRPLPSLSPRPVSWKLALRLFLLLRQLPLCRASVPAFTTVVSNILSSSSRSLSVLRSVRYPTLQFRLPNLLGVDLSFSTNVRSLHSQFRSRPSRRENSL